MLAADAGTVNVSHVAPGCKGDACLAPWLHDAHGQHACLPNGMCTKENMYFYCYKPTAAWGRYQARLYGAAASALGFDGVHWDTLGHQPCGAVDAEAYITADGFGTFLKAAKAELASLTPSPLLQTLNWVGAWGYRKEAHRPLVTFPYAECWEDDCQRHFLGNGSGLGEGGYGGVLAYYPCTNATFLVGEWAYAASKGSSYLVLSDGARHLTNEYFPNAQKAPLGEDEASALEQFWKGTCRGVLPPATCECGAACAEPGPVGNCHDWGCGGGDVEVEEDQDAGHADEDALLRCAPRELCAWQPERPVEVGLEEQPAAA